MKKILIVALIGSLLTGCSVFAGTPTPQVVRETVMVTVEVPGPVETVIVEITPEPPAETEAPRETEEPVATEAPPACTGYKLLSTVPFGPLDNNMDVGDPNPDIHAVLQAWDSNDPETTFHAFIQGTYNLDFEASMIEGTFWLFEGTPEDVACRAQEMYKEKGEGGYRLHVGAIDPVDGWSIELPAPGFEMNMTRFTQIPIYVEGADWGEPINFTKRDSMTHCTEEDVHYFQAWDGSNSNVVYHVILAKGKCVTTSSLQGTEWPVSGDFEMGKLYSRFEQMSTEVQERDNPDTIYRIYLGEGTAPIVNWTTDLPAGWSVSDP